MKEVVIVSAARTAVGDFQGSLESLKAHDLGVIALKGAMEKGGISPNVVEEVMVGQCNQAGSPGNSARWVTLKSGCPVETISTTIHQQCPSSMRAADILSQEIMLGRIDVAAAVGQESMTNAPYLLMQARKGYRLNDAEKIQDSLMIGGLVCAFEGYHMGITGENIAEMYKITREEQDEYSLLSHQRACKAIEQGLFKDEIVPVEIKTRKGLKIFDTDEHANPNATIEIAAKARPVFKKDGTVTAFNASGLNDGAAAIIMMSSEKAKELGLKPLARVVASASGAVEPRIMGMGVVPAVERALKFAGLKKNDIDYWEINEAFAAQFLGCQKELDIPLERVNAVGSGISLGHAVGMTGVRIIMAAINELNRRGGRYACATMCASGGPGCAFIVEQMP
ncbi:thiolase family protein [Desulfosporosinus hippei]|uniref:Acetyl-CoA acetyltransferase n=1 Tax=Desulfosporosinus hippei DSM 8344 TaxID=1121419 RepID=A0A1G8I4K8_9FIRM|nr:thiolase family protein [Desulfosporosinus hippei]SDI13580.1 acetyl-CoA C-acetyltransferase [Desulfosporosinus hippei DSM 8344]